MTVAQQLGHKFEQRDRQKDMQQEKLYIARDKPSKLHLEVQLGGLLD